MGERKISSEGEEKEEQNKIGKKKRGANESCGRLLRLSMAFFTAQLWMSLSNETKNAVRFYDGFRVRTVPQA